jgi:hypothetical protein
LDRREKTPRSGRAIHDVPGASDLNVTWEGDMRKLLVAAGVAVSLMFASYLAFSPATDAG